ADAVHFLTRELAGDEPLAIDHGLADRHNRRNQVVNQDRHLPPLVLRDQLGEQVGTAGMAAHLDGRSPALILGLLHRQQPGTRGGPGTAFLVPFGFAGEDEILVFPGVILRGPTPNQTAVKRHGLAPGPRVLDLQPEAIARGVALRSVIETPLTAYVETEFC